MLGPGRPALYPERVQRQSSVHSPNRGTLSCLWPVGLNKYLFEMANIRNQCTWVHQGEPELATQKCKDLVNMAVAKARLLWPLDYVTVGVDHTALVRSRPPPR